MADWFERLTHAAKQAGDQPIVWSQQSSKSASGTGPRLLILPKAGRIMACEMAGVMGNLFFHHQPLEEHNHAANLYATGGGIGGDRLWIAPESAFMWKELAKVRHDLAANAHTPAAMDPAGYRIESQSDSHLKLTTAMTLEDHRAEQSLSLRVSRQFQMIDPPADLPDAVQCMSFAIRNELELLQGGPKTHAGTWDLLQLPAGGTLICPTLARADSVRSYYEPLDYHVRVVDDAVLFKVDATRRVKMGLRPELTTGRMGYYRKAGDVSTLIVRLFLPCPGQLYVDLPVDEILEGARQGGDALQAYNHNDADMAFGEMEYHDPAVQQGSGPKTTSGQCVTHVLAGPDAKIRQAGRRLLGVDIVE